MSLQSLPAVNAALNSLSFLLLVAGVLFVKRKNVEAHKRCMLAALVTSTLFLVCYLVYHAQVGSVKFLGSGWIRGLYFAILLSHTILAAAVPFLAGVTVWRAWKGEIDRHRRIAKITFPIWLYVSITGVVIYGMLYHLPVDRMSAP